MEDKTEPRRAEHMLVAGTRTGILRATHTLVTKQLGLRHDAAKTLVLNLHASSIMCRHNIATQNLSLMMTKIQKLAALRCLDPVKLTLLTLVS